jgi:hypothetical protein
VGIKEDRVDDQRMLREVADATALFDEDDARFDERTRRAFSDFGRRLKLNPHASLTDAQRRWLRATHERLTGTPNYENAWSAGKVPTGRPVETPAVLRNLPLKPPPRRTSEDA